MCDRFNTCAYVERIAIDDSGHLTDPLGLKIAELPVDPVIARMLLMSGEFGVSLVQHFVVMFISLEIIDISFHSAQGRSL